MKKLKFETGANFMVNALRQLGYTNYSAIADIIDNSIEGEVGAKNVFIDLIKCEEDRTTFSDILISDDGCGMDEEKVHSCMKLGSRTGKDYEHNLGVYGAGLKTAAISIGKRLTVHTKTDEGTLFRAILDIDQINERLDRTVTRGDYAVVEQSFKQYLKDNFDVSMKIADILNDEKITDVNYVLSADDFKDGYAILKKGKKVFYKLNRD